MEVFRSASLTPDEVLAGDSVEFVIALTVGVDYTPGPSRIILDLPGTLGMSRPSLSHQEDNGFVEAYVSAPDVTYLKRNWDMEIGDFPTRTRTSWRGMAQRLFVLDLSAGLRAGDTIAIHWGDVADGYGPGTKVTTVVPRPDYALQVHVRYFAGVDRGLPDLGRSFRGFVRPAPDVELTLPLRVRPRAPCRLRLIRRAAGATLLPLDPFGNVADVPDPAVLADSTPAPARNAMGAFDYAGKDVCVRAPRLPLSASPPMHSVFEGFNLYWGDVHTHSSLSNDCIEREKMDMTPARLLDFGRWRAGLDFMAVTDHHQPWDVERNRIGESGWAQAMEAAAARDRAGEFAVFAGLEFRCRRGDTVVLFADRPAYADIDRPEWTDIRRVWEGLRGRDVLTIPHFHNQGGLAAGEWWENITSGVEPVLETFSCHGSYECEEPQESGRGQGKGFRPDRCLHDFLRRGLRYGVVANSDGHKGHVGSSGLTAVFARSLDRVALLEAYRARRVYGTSNARILLVFAAEGRLMGSVLPNVARKRFAIDVCGESALKRVDLFRDGELARRFAPSGDLFHVEVEIEDERPGAWHVRAVQRDNHIAVSSPVWFE